MRSQGATSAGISGPSPAQALCAIARKVKANIQAESLFIGSSFAPSVSYKPDLNERQRGEFGSEGFPGIRFRPVRFLRQPIGQEAQADRPIQRG